MKFDGAANRERIAVLRSRGVEVWGPERVYVDSSVELGAIETGAVLRQATLSGHSLMIGAGSVIGTSGHAEVKDCQIGRGVRLGSGLYQGATLLDGVAVRGFAEIRPGTLLEEQVDLAHCVALKNTTFTACCVAGSLINFCDLFLSGGTSRQDHTEVGSGAVHYNFDPWADKWGSLLGGIRGVLLRSDPIFIGGTSGLVGPVEVGFGAVVAAGTTIRRSVKHNTLVAAGGKNVRIKGFDRKRRGAVVRAIETTSKLVATLHALDAWYRLVRIPSASERERKLYEAACGRIRAQARERVRRLGRVVKVLGKPSVDASGSTDAAYSEKHARVVGAWPALNALLDDPLAPRDVPADFIASYRDCREGGQSHLEAVRTARGPRAASAWLDGLVAGCTQQAGQLLVGV